MSSAGAGRGGPGAPHGPDVPGIALGLLALVVALLSLARQFFGLAIEGGWVGPTAALAVGGILVLIGLAGLIRRR